MPIAYQAGRFLPLSELQIAPHDAGFAMGVGVTDQCRTYQLRPFRLDDHLARFARSCELCDVECPLSITELRQLLFDLLDRIVKTEPGVADWSLVWCVTPGLMGSYLGQPGGVLEAKPRLIAYAFPVDSSRFKHYFTQGAVLHIARRVHSPGDFTVLAKQRSRLHWYLAEREVKRKNPQAQALLLDHNGCITETASGNLLLVREGSLYSPSTGSVLPGVTLEVVQELAGTLRIPFVEASLTEADLATAEEAILTSTPFGIAPVSQIEERSLRIDGETYRKLQAAWDAMTLAQ